MTTYLDNASTTNITEEVFREMLPYLREHFENPSSMYDNGINNKKVINTCRAKVAGILNCSPNEIYFTSGGSESNNWALKGIAFKSSKKAIITTKIEHHATLHACEFLERMGYIIKYVNTDNEGFVDLKHLESLLNENTALVSVMLANNEIGTIQDIESISELCRRKGVLLHTDAVQAVGHIPVDIKKSGVDLLSLSAHKFHGPKGIGCLYIKKGIEIESLIHGGKQEYGRRGGTENTPYIVGLAKALELTAEKLEQESVRQRGLARLFLAELKKTVPDVILNGPEIGQRRLPGNINISFKETDGSILSYLLGAKGILVSTGSACNSGSVEPSHVLQVIKVDHNYINGSLRVTLGDETSEDDIRLAVNSIAEIIKNKQA